jgi:uncharacterized protein (TIGR03382 family)
MRTSSVVIIASLTGLTALVPTTAFADDTWSEPYPGISQLHRVTSNQNLWVAKIDLCAPGVSVEATGSDRRRRTVPSYGELVGAQLAINGDFTDVAGGTYSTDGIAMHNGEQWPGSADHNYVTPLAFGDHRVSMPPHWEVVGTESWMKEIISGHPTLISNGEFHIGPDASNVGDPTCDNRHPRTAAGLSADKRTLILAVVDGRAPGRAGMDCGALAALMSEMGAADAVNLDGGGSSTMWTSESGVVNRPSDGTPRVVGNHLGIHATGSGDAPNCPGIAPRGFLDVATCEQLAGWTQDEDVSTSAIPVRLVFGGPLGVGSEYVPVMADNERGDLCTAIGSCNHGFNVAVPPLKRNGEPHEVWAYGADNYGGFTVPLANSGTVIRCAPLATPLDPSSSVRRHITNDDAFKAWKWTWWDLNLPGADIANTFVDGTALPDVPRVVSIDGAAAVYVVDGPLLRHLRNQESIAAWRITPEMMEAVSSADVSGLTIGAKWPAAPYVMVDGAQEPKSYILDVADPTMAEPALPDDDKPDEPGADGNSNGGCSSSGHPGSAAVFMLMAMLLIVGRRSR